MTPSAGTISVARRCCAVAFPAAVLAFGLVAARADEELKLTHQGIERTAILHLGAGAIAPRPLVIALHGLGGTGKNFQGYARLDAAADREGFVVVYPDAIERSWSYGRPIVRPMPVINGETVDDVGFIGLLIDDLVNRKIADPARVYVTGISRGGLMAFTLACALADRIAAAAPLITGMTDLQREDCRPSRPVPIMVIAGTADQMQSFGGAQLANGRLLSIPETIDFWRLRYGCSGRDVRRLPHRDEADRTQVMLLEWRGCQSGSKLRLYRVEGGGHQLPSLIGTANPMSEEKFGLRNRDIETAEEVWAFFKDLAR
jgi:polyhydroxybutyrate depolymerase